MSIESDLAAILSGWDSRALVLGNFTGGSVVQEMDILDTDRGGEPVMVRRTVARVRRSDFQDSDGNLTVIRGDALTLDGVAYTVSDTRIGGLEKGGFGPDIDARVLHLIVRKV